MGISIIVEIFIFKHIYQLLKSYNIKSKRLIYIENCKQMSLRTERLKIDNIQIVIELKFKYFKIFNY